MEKFGDKYCHDNPDAFGSAECIYLLSYATMMLQTSIQAQKSRMSLDDFVKMTKGINSGKDLSRDFIAEIYESVEKEPFTLTEDEDAKLKLEAVQATSLKRKQDLYMKEAQNLSDSAGVMEGRISGGRKWASSWDGGARRDGGGLSRGRGA